MSTDRVRHFLRPLAAASAAGALTLAGLAAPAVSEAGPAKTPIRPAAVAPPPGLIGVPINLTNQEQFDGYDVATNADGTSYVGWISTSGANADRTVHLCVIPAGQLSCPGGVQSTESLDVSGAEGLRVLISADATVNLVWFHDTDASIDGPNGAQIAYSTVTDDGALSPAVDIGDAPSFGSLQDAQIGPDQEIWTVAANPAGVGPLQVRDGSGPAVKVATPWTVGFAKLAFAGSTPILGATKAGAVSTPVRAASLQNGVWTAFAPVPKTWSVDTNFGLQTVGSGARLITSTNNSDYSPVVARWTAGGFATPTLTGETSTCAPPTHDTATDASGRIVDVTEECTTIAISNLQDTTHAAVVRISAKSTFAGGIPQIATTPRGRALVVWSTETDGSVNQHLYVAAVRLAPLTTSKTKGVRGGTITLSGPVSCLPAVAVPISLSARANGAAGWHAGSTNLQLNATALGSHTINGAALTPGASYTLTGSATFSKNGTQSQGTATLVFRACPRP